MKKTPMTLLTEQKLNEFDYSIFDGIPGAMAGIEAYENFYSQFKYWDEAQKEMALHKFYHTLMVAKKMVELAPTEEAKKIYFWVGVLHDFGRYYDICGGSFAGSKVNHAEVGAEVLFKYRIIKLFPDIPEEMYASIEPAVRFHGVLSLEDSVNAAGVQLTDEQWQLCYDIRTADKWDIFDFLLWLPTVGTCGASEEQIAQMTVSERTMNELLNHKLIDRGAEEYTNIRWFLSHVGFIYDKNDQRLMNWLHETGWVAKYLAKLYECNPKDIERLKEIQTSAEKFLEDVYVR